MNTPIDHSKTARFRRIGLALLLVSGSIAFVFFLRNRHPGDTTEIAPEEIALINSVRGWIRAQPLRREAAAAARTPA